MQEFDIINQFFNQPVSFEKTVCLGIGDDAAVIEIPPNYQLATSIDTLVEGVHFPIETDPRDIGYKSLAVSLSDMAAMGAKALHVLLALTLPDGNEHWVQSFAMGFFELANHYDVALIGGDTTRGPLSISTVVNGIIPTGKAITRSGAKPNDDIYVTGTLGDAGLALQQLKQKVPVNPYLLQRLNRPEPRLMIGQALLSIASSGIDISDGLAADLSKLLTASGVGAIIQTKDIPLSTALRDSCSIENAYQFALSAGDDYELCFTVAPDQSAALQAALRHFNCPWQRIGKIKEEPGLVVLDANNQILHLTTAGYEHFKTDTHT